MSPDQRQDPKDPGEDPEHTGNPNRVGMRMSAPGSDFTRSARQINDQENGSGNECYDDEESNNP